jgi:hypothetical protein
MWSRRVGKTCPRLRPGIAYTVIQRATVPGDFAHAVRRCEGRVGKRAATYAFRSTPERARFAHPTDPQRIDAGCQAMVSGLQLLRFAQFRCVNLALFKLVEGLKICHFA